jgi:hypothetical protein
MSWAINAVGKPAAVAAKLAKDFASIKCPEPEESIKAKLAEAVALALAAFPPQLAVRVEASGSQYSPNANKPTEFQNNFKIDFSVIYGFVE